MKALILALVIASPYLYYKHDQYRLSNRVPFDQWTVCYADGDCYTRDQYTYNLPDWSFDVIAYRVLLNILNSLS